MKYKKIMFMLVLAVFLLSITCVSASEIDNTIASENANTIELSTDNDIEDNLQTSEENMVFTSTDYDEAIAQTDTEVLGEGSAKYSDLAEEIRHSGNITLTHKNYTYDGRATAITISEANKVIDGNGAVIDMNGSTIRAFTVTASDVTIKNLTIKNANYNGDGGAIYFTSSATSGTVTNCNFTDNTADYGGAVYFWDPGTVTNCNFVNNTASEEGGAVYFWDPGTVSNCNFVDNKATGDDACGGAVYFQSTGNVTNCNFTDNTATMYGGAIFFVNTGNVTNCNFADNSAFEGGAIFSMECYTTVDTCIFKRNSGDNVNTVIYPPTLNVNNFTTVHGSGEKLTFDLKTNSSIPVTNGNISISVYFKGNGDWVRNYTCLSGEGWIPDLPVGSYIAFFDTEYAKFQKINRTITITAPEHTFWFLNYTINGNDNPVIELSHDFYFDPAYDAAFVNGIVINRPVTIKGNGNAIDANRQARIFYVQSENAVLENLTLKNAHSNSGGGAVYFSGTGEVTNCNFVNYSATGEGSWGGAIRMYSGTVSNCNFTDNSATVNGGAVYFSSTGTVTNCNFVNNSASTHGGAVYFYEEGTVSNCNFINNTATGNGGAVRMTSGTVLNCTFAGNNATGDGGAVYFNGKGDVTNCSFVDNKATGDYSYGGAVYFSSTGTVTNCNFTNNSVSSRGGAVYFSNTGTVANCNFTGNNATTGSAISFYKRYSSDTLTVSNSTFLNNRANAEALDIVKNDNDIAITFTGQNNLLNAIYSPDEVTFTNVTYWGAKGITTISATMSGSNKAAGQNITVGVVVNNELVLSDVMVTKENGMIVLNISAGENYYISARHDTDSYYTEAETTISNNTKFNVNVTSKTTTNKTVNITAKSNIYSEVMPGKLLFILPNGTQINATYGANGIWWAEHTFDAYGEYKVNATYVGLDNVTVNNATITVNKIKTELSGNAITTTYNINKDLIITLKDSNGNPVSGAKLIVDLNGAKTYATDSNGQIKVSTKGLAPKAYTAKVTFNGNDNYAKSTKDVKVTVKKATPKLTAKKKTFKTTTKTKKYTITLKDNTGKAIKKAKVTLKVKGKTYKATTNSKGKAVFKIKNLKKKGTFKATITYKGNKYYNKVSKKANIKVIVSFKTVSKGSKDKSTVKEIQQALKDHGYYLSYKGHYLKVDGKFKSCTERSVKQFQKDKGLKVTGKVDEKTAVKLGII